MSLGEKSALKRILVFVMLGEGLSHEACLTDLPEHDIEPFPIYFEDRLYWCKVEPTSVFNEMSPTCSVRVQSLEA